MNAPVSTNTRLGWNGIVRHEVLVSGIITGLAGGVVMLAVAVLGAATQDMSPLHPALVLGESFVGPTALEGIPKVAFGCLVHLGTSTLIGLLFASIVARDFPMASAIGVGVGASLLVFMFVLMPLFVPWANPGFRSGMQGLGGTWIGGLAVYGVVLGTGPALRRWAASHASALGSPAPRTTRATPPVARPARTS